MSECRTVTASNGTITVAGLGYAPNFGDAGVGAAARFQRANQDKEVKGYTFDYKEFADDTHDSPFGQLEMHDGSPRGQASEVVGRRLADRGQA